MKTYKELKARLVKVGFKDISRNYSGGGTIIHLGYGHNNDQWPAFQLRVFKTQEGGFQSPIHFAHSLTTTDGPQVRVTTLEEVWAAAMAMIPKALTPTKQVEA